MLTSLTPQLPLQLFTLRIKSRDHCVVILRRTGHIEAFAGIAYLPGSHTGGCLASLDRTAALQITFLYYQSVVFYNRPVLQSFLLVLLGIEIQDHDLC